MILSTTPTIEGHPIREYRGVVTGETIIGTNFVKDFFASVRDVIGGRSGSYESTLREAKDTALRGGVIPYIQLGGKILYRESDIQKILMANYREAYRMKGL